MAGPRIELRCYAELNDFLPKVKRRRVLTLHLKEPAGIKDVIEAQGIPHTEVDLLLVRGQSVGFDYLVQDGDRISVYPRFWQLPVGDLSRVRPPELPEPRFILDTHLGRLTALLRMLGFDTLYSNDAEDAGLARLAHQERRILLTRDRGLLKRSVVTHGYHVWEIDPYDQLAEVVRRFSLRDRIAPFTRCLRCNGCLERVDKAEILDRLEPKTRLYYEDFGRCLECGRIYWQGSHYERMRRLVENLAGQSGC